MSETINTSSTNDTVGTAVSGDAIPSKPSPRERLKEITGSIERGIQELFNSDRYRQYLATMSRFHRYSVNNQMLIYMQRPDASLVAGYLRKQFWGICSVLMYSGVLSNPIFSLSKYIP